MDKLCITCTSFRLLPGKSSRPFFSKLSGAIPSLVHLPAHISLPAARRTQVILVPGDVPSPTHASLGALSVLHITADGKAGKRVAFT